MPKVKNHIRTFLIALFSFILLVLSLLNVKNYLSIENIPEKVLGAETNTNAAAKFWERFLDENPEYIPGWLEIGRIDKAYSINPNYQL